VSDLAIVCIALSVCTVAICYALKGRNSRFGETAMTVIEVASIRPPRAGRSPGHVIDASGACFECWPEKLGKLQVGQRYAVEVETREWQGRGIRKIVRATPADGGAKKSAPTRPERRDGNGLAKTTANPVSADAGQAFVATVLCAFIAAGKVGLDADEIAAAIDTVRSGCRRARQLNGGAHAH
jgi:hypothetical protein